MKHRPRVPALHRPALASLCLCAALLATAAGAQDPQIEGTWNLDIAASDERRNGPPLVDTRLTLALVGEDVKITREFTLGQGPARTHEATYVTDGKPHDVPAILTPTQTVRARWRKEKLQISYSVDRGGFALDVTEVWSIDKEDALQVAYSTRVQDRNITRKEIYRRE
jgi:hypothetical protein